MFFFSLLAFGLQAYAQSANLLGDFPLAVKTPYLHCWAPSHNNKAPESVFPNLFTLRKHLGWSGMIRVDGQPYQWFGDWDKVNFSTTAATDITPTRTIFTFRAGHMQFNATFFTPIETNNYTLQSIPFSYLFVDGFVADDGQPHTIQLYSDISAEWVSNEDATLVSWDTQVSSNMVYHRVHPQTPQPMVDDTDYAEDATAYYATPQRSGLTWQIGAEHDNRSRFAQNGTLGNTSDNNFRAIWDDGWPTFSFAIDLGSVLPNNQPDPVVWTLGLVRDPLVNYATESGLQLRTGHYWSAYSKIDDVILDFLGDLASARLRGQSFDNNILDAALQVSPEYAGIISLVTRQVFASMDITIPVGEGGQPNASDVKIFMKDVSMSTRANPVEVIYAALPALLYLNASFAHDLLLPLLEFQSSPSYRNVYASPDLGSRYPTIAGNTSDTEELALEHCGNMLIMVYAHAAKSGDNSLISEYHPLLQKWAEYLVQNSLHPNNAISGDGFGYPGMSNLALKGVLGVYSMAKMNEIIDSSNTTFRDKANELIQDWKNLAVLDTHIQVEYGKPSTWGLMYNLFPAVWLQTGLTDDDILNNEAQFYLSNAPPGGQSYSLDNEQSNGIAYPHWTLMTAAIIPSRSTPVRDILIRSTYFQAYNASQRYTLPMRYAASSGIANPETMGSPALGAAYGILAMSMKNVGDGGNGLTSSPGGGSSGDGNVKKKSPVAAIVGGIVGGTAFILLLGAVIFFLRRRQTQRLRVKVTPLYEKGQTNFNARHAALNENGIASLMWNRRPHANILPWTMNESPRRQDAEGLYNTIKKGHRSPPVTGIPPIILPLRKEREVSQQNPSRQNEPAPAVAHERREALRAEVDELRREMESIRNIAQPPPSYRGD